MNYIHSAAFATMVLVACVVAERYSGVLGGLITFLETPPEYGLGVEDQTIQEIGGKSIVVLDPEDMKH